MSSLFSLSRFAAVIAEPERLTHMESWHRHMPFAFAILDMLKPRIFVELGSHWGDSYCAFCQGVTRQKLPTRCYAVDTWQGDEHAGHYGDEVYEDLSSWHNPRYTAFSSLLRMTFDEALAQFPDSSVDLLHIDGLHTYEAVQHDFTTWLPKMSSRGVVLFHDTNVRHADFGVWKLWAELADQYPSFEFPYGFGLGVLAVGTDVPQDVLDFLTFARHNSQAVVDFFHRHGDAAEIRKKNAEIRRIQQHLNTLGAELGEVRTIAQERSAFVEELQRAWQGTQADLQSEQERFLEEACQYEERLASALGQLDKVTRQHHNTTLQLNRSLQLLQDRAGQIAQVQQFNQMLLGSRWWQLRNSMLRLAGQDKRVLNAMALPQPAVRWEPPSQQPAVTIIVPVYGGVQDTRDCIESILASDYRVRAQLVVINDASPEPELVEWLNANDTRFILLHNEINLGFVGTVNRGMALYPEQDVVLVNSDTEVANDWLDRLQQAAYGAADIGSVTPFSNNATICSYPDFCHDNQLPEGYDVKRLDALAACVNTGLTVDVPTAVGFCMYIRRDCLHDAGAFDAELFGRGYGEENEFCMRSAQRGWRHVLTGDTFVYHKGGVSFAETQSENQRHGHKVLTSLYPDYDWIIQQHVAADPARPLRFALDAARAAESGQPVVLMINHGRGGGSQKHLDQLVARLADQVHCFLLTPDANDLLHLRSYTMNEKPVNGVYFHPGQHALLLETLRQLRVARIHFHHSIDLSHDVLSLPEHLACPYDITIHDFFFACPQVTLADERGRYCGAPDEAGCNACLARRPVAELTDIQSWRSQNEIFLQGAEHVYVPSRDTLQRMHRYFPDVCFTWALHEKEQSSSPVHAQPVKSEENLRIVVLGALSAFKGADVLEQVAMLARKQRAPIELHLLGYAYRPLRTWPATALHVHGAYQDSQLPDRLQTLQPHVAWFTGSCPETWSYTLSSTLAAGLPAIAPDVGAFPERLAGREWSWLVPVDRAPDEILQHLLQVRTQMITAQQPPVVTGEPVQATFDYSRSYAAGIKHVQAGAELSVNQWNSLTPQLLGLGSQQPEKELLPGIRPLWVRKLLIRALQRGWLQSTGKYIPYDARQKIKALLTRT
ncbi:MAG: glycosyltransferase [Gammaproteobacteria bacterium]|nr:glycosyltransferase [Gammaproteobacteria bacterium]